MNLIVVLPGIETISVELVLNVIAQKVSSDRRFSLSLHGLSDSDPVLKKAMWFAFTKNKFLEFCIQEGINPVGLSALTVTGSYLEDDSQGREYGISVENFRLFSQSLGFKVFSQIEYEQIHDAAIRVSQESEMKLQNERAQPIPGKVIQSRKIQLFGFNGPKPLRRRFEVRRHQPTAEASEDDFWDPDIDEALRNKKKVQQEKLKKTPPGTLSKIRIRKLAVRTAWEIEVDTKQPAKCVEVMTELCKLAESDDKPSWLIKQVLDVKKQPAVIWRTTTEVNKQFRRADCQNALKKWRDSYLKK